MLMELGRLTFDVKLETVKNGETKVLNNRVAIQHGKETIFVDIVAWDNKAELIANHYKKGYEILFEGFLIEKNKKKDGIEFKTIAIQIERVIFTSGNPKAIDIDNEDIPDFLK